MAAGRWRFPPCSLPAADRCLSHPRHTLSVLLMDASLLASAPVDDLAETVAQLHAAGCALQRTLLEVVAAFDGRRLWEEDGAASMAAWLVGRLGISYSTGLAWCGTADRLRWLPGLAGAFEEGRLSWDQVRAAAEVVTVATEEAVLADALGSSAARLERAARRARESSRRAGETLRSVRWWWEAQGVQWRLSGYLPAEEGAVVQQALASVADRTPRRAETGLYDPYEVRAADALVELAEAAAAVGNPAPATLVVHVEAESLAAASGTAEVEGGPVLSAQVARRLACDARVQIVAEGPDGSTVGIGRAARTVPPWLARQVRHRDQGCRFPGCERTRWVHLHHLVHWADGGGTDLDNLVSLCGHHHRLVHEGGWRLAGHPDRRLTFLRPDRRAFRPGPEPLRPEVRAGLVDPLLPAGPDPPD